MLLFLHKCINYGYVARYAYALDMLSVTIAGCLVRMREVCGKLKIIGPACKTRP